MIIYTDLKFDLGVLQKVVMTLLPQYIQLIIMLPYLIVITVLPQNTDAYHILFQIIGTTHMRPCQKAESARVYFQRLVNSKLH